MKVSYDLEQGYIDVWNEKSEKWDRYIKVNKKSIVEEEKKIPEKIGVINYAEDQATALIHHKVDEIIDYLQSKGE